MATTPSVTPGQQVWVADAAECYQLAKVSAISGGTVTATTQNGQSVSTKEFSHSMPTTPVSRTAGRWSTSTRRTS